MAINLTQSPNQYNLAYGPNAVALSNIGTLDRKYVLQLKRGNELIADVRQLPNTAGYAIFDIQNILQSFIEQSRSDIETRVAFTNSENETMYYQLHCGAENASGVVTIDVITTLRIAMGGTKPYYEVNWDSSDVTPVLSMDESIFECTIVDTVADALTDMVTYPNGNFSGGRPANFLTTTPVYNIKLTENDNHTISYWNNFEIGPGGAPVAATQQAVEAVEVIQYNGNSFITADVIFNTTANTGGPNTTPGEGLAVLYPFHALTFASGPKNGSFTLSNQCTHYYVYPRAHSPSACTPGQLSSWTHNPLRVDIVEPNCNDYEHIPFSWTNSYGFRDYFTFTKKNEKSLSIKRNTYFKESADYAGTTYQVTPEARGTTTYSQMIKEQYRAMTDWLTDDEAQYLEKLFTAPDVRVKFGNDWYPVTSLTNAYTKKTYRKDKLFQYEIRFELAHPVKSQRG